VPFLKIAYDDKGVSIGRYIVDANTKKRIDLMRSVLDSGERTAFLHGPKGSGKSIFAEQIASVLGYPLIPLNNQLGVPMPIEITAEGTVYHETLTADTVDALTTLSEPVLLHVGANLPLLQAALAAAMSPVGDHTLRLHPAHFADAFEIKIHPATVAIFEVTDGPCMSFSALKDTTPISFFPLSDYVREHISSGLDDNRQRLRDPVRRTRVRDKDLDKLVNQRTLRIREAAHALEKVFPIRSRIELLKSMHERFTALNPEMRGERGQSFVERVLSQMEMQAWLGDNRADRTASLLFPPDLTDSGEGLEETVYPTELWEHVQRRVDFMFSVGEAARQD
jgi:hypothetical protein